MHRWSLSRQADHYGHSCTVIRNPEKRKVGGSTPPLTTTTTSEQRGQLVGSPLAPRLTATLTATASAKHLLELAERLALLLKRGALRRRGPASAPRLALGPPGARRATGRWTLIRLAQSGRREPLRGLVFRSVVRLARPGGPEQTEQADLRVPVWSAHSRMTSADTHGRSAAGHARCGAGSPWRDMASGRRGHSHCRRAMAGGSQPFRPATCWRNMPLAY